MIPATIKTSPRIAGALIVSPAVKRMITNDEADIDVKVTHPLKSGRIWIQYLNL